MSLFLVLGCPDADPPDEGWNQRNGDVLLVGCSKISESWFMYCSDFEWKGDMKNCSSLFGEHCYGMYHELYSLLIVHTGTPQGIHHGPPSYFSPGAALVSFLTFCFGIIIVLVGASLLKRNWRWCSEILTTSGDGIYDLKFQCKANQSIIKQSMVSYGVTGNRDVNLFGNEQKSCSCENNNVIFRSIDKFSPPPLPVRSSSCCTCDSNFIELVKSHAKPPGHVFIELIQTSNQKSIGLSSKNDLQQVYLL